MKQRILLAFLATEVGRVISADRIIEELWGAAVPVDPVNALHHQVSRLRRSVGNRVVSRSSGYVLDVPADEVDARRFERLALDGRAALRAGEAERAASTLRAALQLWRGDPLAEFADHEWARVEASRLVQICLGAMEDRFDAELALGLHADVAAEIDALVKQHPFRERLWGQLMVALYRCGQQADALEAYREARRQLATVHGLDPGRELEELEAAILARDPSLAAVAVRDGDIASRASAVQPSARSNLPSPLTTFIGRHDQLVAIRRLLEKDRLITLTGPPGVGKTRLALEAGRAVTRDFPDGVWLVELAPLSRPELVADIVASVLGAREPGRSGEALAADIAPDSPLGRVIEHLRSRRALLILDNCEHLLPGVASLVEPLLASSPGLTILATSREAPVLAGEAQWPVPPLSLPGPRVRDPRELAASEAVRLFEDRAAKVRPSFALRPETAAAVAQVCRHLDGLPLAIELAAARVKAFPVEHIAAALHDRFRLLVAASRAAAPRQQTLRATVDWSYDLLSADEQTAFDMLSVFAGGCSLAEAQSLAEQQGIGPQEMLDLLGSLVDKSLLLAVDDAVGEPRFEMLETLREYGRDRLADKGGFVEARQAHRRLFLELAQGIERGLLGAEFRSWHVRAEKDYENLGAAFDSALEDGDVETALGIANALWWFWAITDRHAEGRARLEVALAPATEAVPAALRASALAALCYLAGQQMDLESAATAGECALDLSVQADDPAAIAWAQQTLSLVLADAGELERSAQLLAEARATREAAGEDWHVAGCDFLTALVGIRLGRTDQVEQVSRGVLVRARRMGYEPFECWSELLLGVVAERRGDLDGATREHEMALDLAERLALPHHVAFSLSQLGRLAMLQGDLRRAEELHVMAVDTAEVAGSRWFAALARTGLAAALRAGGNVQTAKSVLREVLAWGEGREARTRETFFIALGGSPVARSLSTLGVLTALDGDLPEAERLLLAGLQRAETDMDTVALALALEGLAGAAAADGRGERAAVLLGAADSLRASTAQPLHPAERADVDWAAASARSLLGSDAFAASLTRGRALSPTQAITLVNSQ